MSAQVEVRFETNKIVLYRTHGDMFVTKGGGRPAPGPACPGISPVLPLGQAYSLNPKGHVSKEEPRY